MSEGLVDLSLFAVSPTNDHQFTIPEIPPYRYRDDITTYRGYYGDVPDDERDYDDVAWPAYGTYQPAPRVWTNKPLPPLPRRRLCERRSDLGREDLSSRCILRRIRRIRTDVQPRTHGDTLQQRRNSISTPQLTLSVPQQYQEEGRGRPALPMVWLPDEQMWLIVDSEDFDTYRTSAFEPLPLYTPPRSARSEPSVNRPDSEFSPVRSQFRTLMDRRPEQRFSPPLQEAISGLTVWDYFDYEDPSSLSANPVEADWHSETSRNSWHSAESGVSALSEDPSHLLGPSEWEGLALEILRPSSAM